MERNTIDTGLLSLFLGLIISVELQFDVLYLQVVARTVKSSGMKKKRMLYPGNTGHAPGTHVACATSVLS